MMNSACSRVIARRHSLDVTSLDHVTTSHAHRRRHDIHRSSSSSTLRAQLGPPTTSRPRPLSADKSYEQQLEEHLDQMRLRVTSAQHELIAEKAKRHQLLRRMKEMERAHTATLARLTTQSQRTTDSLKARVRLSNTQTQQLREQLLRLEHQLTAVTNDNTRLEMRLQRQQQQQQPQRQEQECRVERRDVHTQTTQQPLDLSTLYQLFTSITLTRLDQLELHANHLPSPANQRRRTTSLPADDVTHDNVTRSVSPVSRRDDDVIAMTSDRKSRDASLLRLDIFKKLQPSRRGIADVINVYKRPIRVRRDIAPADVTVMTSYGGDVTSSFKRLQQRRNGLCDLSQLH